MEPIISVSGLRGVVGDSLTPAVAQRFVAAYAAELPSGAVVIGHDGGDCRVRRGSRRHDVAGPRNPGQAVSVNVRRTSLAFGPVRFEL